MPHDIMTLEPDSPVGRKLGPTLPRPAFSKDGIWLYVANCLDVMEAIARKHPNGCFDMIFADPPYFLSNGGITCQAGQMAKVDKGD